MGAFNGIDWTDPMYDGNQLDPTKDRDRVEKLAVVKKVMSMATRARLVNLPGCVNLEACPNDLHIDHQGRNSAMSSAIFLILDLIFFSYTTHNVNDDCSSKAYQTLPLAGPNTYPTTFRRHRSQNWLRGSIRLEMFFRCCQEKDEAKEERVESASAYGGF